ncbi:MAG: hypothetical protein KDA85_18355, partial [Planctomycetaceae bacterium]|nr:hypothetical protein [Planctomycetaceae bacterium]
MNRLLLGVLTLGICCAAGVSGDWPAWRGPDRDDLCRETGLLSKWPEGGPPKVWTSSEAGLGYSGLAVVGDKIY